MRQRRRKSYNARRDRVRRISNHKKAIIIAVFTLLVTVFSVILGNCLGQTVKEQEKNELESPSPERIRYETLSDVRVNAKYFDISEISYTPVATIERWAALGRTSVSLTVRRTSGKLNYNSEIAKALGKDETSGLDIRELIGTFDDNNIHVSGIFESSFMFNTEGLNDVYSAYEIQLVGELHSAGVDDILISGLKIDSENIETALDFLYDIRSKYKDAVIGVSMPYGVASSESGSYVAYMLSGVCDYIALDLSDVYESGELTERISDSVYYISRYDARILLDSSLGTAVEILEELGIGNWQYVN
ncbi:MAG: hypothetical protein II365_01640 [Clostridia bacterium]|nr:hypothetical protein [Clostridia bacterium]